MTHQNDFTVPAEIMEQIVAEGIEYGPQMIAILINVALNQYFFFPTREEVDECEGIQEREIVLHLPLA